MRITNGILLTMEGQNYNNGYVDFENGVITAVGDAANAPAYDGEVLDAQGGYIMPGLIDAHIHAHRSDDILTALRIAREFNLRCSITHTTGGAAFFRGVMNAAATDLTLTVRGKGCHSTHPHQGTDAIVASAQIITALQSVVSRSIAPVASGVVTIGTISGGTKENIIADAVTMTGTIRALDPQTQSHLKKTVRRIVENTAAAELHMEDQYPALINNDSLTEKLMTLARDVLGPEQAIAMKDPSLGADDFAFFSNQVPGCYFNVGVRSEGLPGQVLHSPTFVPHETSLETALLVLRACIHSWL